MVVAYLVILVRKGYNGEFLFGNSFFLGVNGLPGSPGMQGPRGERGMQRKSFLNYRQMMIVLGGAGQGFLGETGVPGTRGRPGGIYTYCSCFSCIPMYFFSFSSRPSWKSRYLWCTRPSRITW